MKGSQFTVLVMKCSQFTVFKWWNVPNLQYLSDEMFPIYSILVMKCSQFTVFKCNVNYELQVSTPLTSLLSLCSRSSISICRLLASDSSSFCCVRIPLAWEMKSEGALALIPTCRQWTINTQGEKYNTVSFSILKSTFKWRSSNRMVHQSRRRLYTVNPWIDAPV